MAIAGLAPDAGNRGRLQRAGALDVAVSAMHAHPSNAQVLQWGRHVARALAADIAQTCCAPDGDNSMDDDAASHVAFTNKVIKVHDHRSSEAAESFETDTLTYSSCSSTTCSLRWEAPAEDEPLTPDAELGSWVWEGEQNEAALDSAAGRLHFDANYLYVPIVVEQLMWGSAAVTGPQLLALVARSVARLVFLAYITPLLGCIVVYLRRLLLAVFLAFIMPSMAGSAGLRHNFGIQGAAAAAERCSSLGCLIGYFSTTSALLMNLDLNGDPHSQARRRRRADAGAKRKRDSGAPETTSTATAKAQEAAVTAGKYAKAGQHGATATASMQTTLPSKRRADDSFPAAAAASAGAAPTAEAPMAAWTAAEEARRDGVDAWGRWSDAERHTSKVATAAAAASLVDAARADVSAAAGCRDGAQERVHAAAAGAARAAPPGGSAAARHRAHGGGGSPRSEAEAAASAAAAAAAAAATAPNLAAGKRKKGAVHGAPSSGARKKRERREAKAADGGAAGTAGSSRGSSGGASIQERSPGCKPAAAARAASFAPSGWLSNKGNVPGVGAVKPAAANDRTSSSNGGAPPVVAPADAAAAAAAGPTQESACNSDALPCPGADDGLSASSPLSPPPRAAAPTPGGDGSGGCLRTTAQPQRLGGGSALRGGFLGMGWLRGGGYKEDEEAVKFFSGGYGLVLPPAPTLPSMQPKRSPMSMMAQESAALVASMRDRPGEATIQLQGLQAIVKQLLNSEQGSIKYTACTRRLRFVGACEVVIAALRNHARDAGVLSWTLQALDELAADEDNRAALGEGGACEAVVATLSGQPADREIVHWGIRAVTGLAHSNPANKKARADIVLVGRGACEAVVAGMKAFPDDADVQEAGLQEVGLLAVANLGCSSAQARLGGAGACEAAARALLAFPAHADVQQEGVHAVATLAYSADNSRRLGAVGVCEPVIRSLRTGPPTLAFRQSALHAIAGLAAVEENRARLCAAGAREALVAAMRAHPRVIDVQRCGAKASARLAAEGGDDDWAPTLCRQTRGVSCEDVVDTVRAYRFGST
ncbi:hypothetical protein JKP88DRAFT_307517 [Tribonema minus]|uniref:Uncharacterized protein n=1 Tax=Tribonema minus TaxID=303371 RepID=A0A836CL21_9STRA|nr:hypothetical protein JKP88DRAFT_307517 [Tribonema minus]